jgi:diaminopimelate decarboxylase
MYGSVHYAENITAEGASVALYDIVGPICESSDVFAKDYALPFSQRGDIIVFRSAGAYGEVMASTYNCRTLPQTFTTEQIKHKYQ